MRGTVNGDRINSELAFRIGAALVDFSRGLKIAPRIVVGRDTRESGPMLEKALAQGIHSSGGEAILAGVIPTPGLAFLAKKMGRVGIVISASHSSFEFNGFKIFKSDGTKLTDEEEETFEGLIFKKNFLVDGLSGREILTDENLAREYVFFLKNIFPPAYNLQRKKIILDCANGATHRVAPRVFEDLGADLTLIFTEPDGRNINADCGSQYTSHLEAAVKKEPGAIGFAFDGDGDRLIAVADDGKTLTGDQILYILARFFLAKGLLKNNRVVSTVMSNINFINALKALELEHLATDVGDRAVFYAMRARGAVLGGEESGHIIFSDFHTTGDGILSALFLLSALDHFKKDLSQLAGELNLAPKALLSVTVRNRPELRLIPEISQAVKKAEASLGSGGRVLVRYSGTEPLCRVMVEGRNEPEIKKLVAEIAEIIEKKLN
ncbi:phosphoglucosamine mutase [Candidatus Falkowbacteria bacterium RIFCSPLOWO2_12_FULL_45_13]|uniref:Phosphoglucosamine mutase n=2 Tax=Candidatus Falkowiibacteriota TaxID=1752728 RepID=A0A1F5SBJ9_9BACT|nr:MAG: phosphoglucosamine mutase [Candidatus Falkowbacteria bacterium RIFCSPLOWO2_02_FULL_45_21]OGF30324.1 MAG: phosphoglucosamine mutase [Candidatus Falkowbacteria bacterium RIFCSPLOWO2_12_FULL_45_13]